MCFSLTDFEIISMHAFYSLYHVVNKRTCYFYLYNNFALAKLGLDQF